MLHIKFSSLTTKQLDNLAGQTVLISEMNANTEIAHHPLFLLIKTNYGLYHANIIKPTFSGMGKDLVKADLKRDSRYGGLKRLLRGFTAFEGTDKSAAARKLLSFFDETDRIGKLDYAEENVVLEKLIEKLTTPEAQDLIAQSGLTNEVNLLIAAQGEFQTLYLQQIEANSQLRQQQSATTLRNELSNALRNYYGYISSMSGVEPWKDIYSDLAELIKKSK